MNRDSNRVTYGEVMKPMEVLERYPKWTGVCPLYVPNAVKNLATDREHSKNGWGRTWVSVFKDRVVLMYQNVPYAHTGQYERESIRYCTSNQMETAIKTLTKVPQASCWD